MKLRYLPAAALLAFAACNGPAPSSQKTAKNQQTNADSLRLQLANISASAGGRVGVAIMNLDTRDTLSQLPDSAFAMQSTYKFPIAMAVLHQVDLGRLKLDQKVHITPEMVAPKTYSPLRDSFPKGNVDLPLSRLIGLMVSQSDNIACDALIDLAGGEAAINDYIHSLGVKDISIVASEAKMAASWDVQFTNWCKPFAFIELLDVLNKGKVLSKTSNEFLWKALKETTTGPGRIKGLLPKDVVVAHKTGSSGSRDGVYPATNDIGIIFLPNGQKLALVVLVSNAKGSDADRDDVIAKIAQAAYDAAVQPQQ